LAKAKGKSKSKSGSKSESTSTQPAAEVEDLGPSTVTDDGVVRILNCEESPHPETDWQYHNAEAAGLLAATTRAVPSSKDLRESWWKIGDQKSTGSCVGWAAADSVLRWHFTKAGRLGDTEWLSPRFQWMASKETDEFTAQPTTFVESAGTSLKAALDISRKWGAVRNSVLPFASGKLYPGEVATFYAIATQLKIAAYFNLGRDVTAWRSWLANNGPILTRLNVDATWDAATQNQGKLSTYKPSTTRGGHAVALVGYTSSNFIVRNSWGTGWGDQGFAYATNTYAKQAFTEAYGVVI
jgi:Papain family cysteine protease